MRVPYTFSESIVRTQIQFTCILIHLVISGKSVEASKNAKSPHLYTLVKGMRGVQNFLKNSKSFLYIDLYIN